MQLHHLASSSLLSLAFLSLGSSALALTQPNGATIPTGSSLQTLFDSRGETISALDDAAITPETFVPTCGLTFTVVQRDSSYKNSFGWYNVTGVKPAVADLHEFLSCNDPQGTMKVLEIKNDPGYAGGEIGFYQATGPCGSLQTHNYIFFSEKKYNPDSDQQNPYIHLLIYNSTATEKAFYFGWEDLLSGGDNDFNDLTTFVTGISCSGGGAACQTGKPGICGDGTMQCQSGTLTCLQTNMPSPEKCDGLDTDCDGLADNGDMICPENQVCDKGSCVPKCGGGEFTCSPDQVCNPAGYCVDPACVDVTCQEGQKCTEGQCVGPCDGVTCPQGQVCRVGACVDPCLAITCDAEQVCKLGACVDKCQCAGCGAAETCQASGSCLPDACVDKVCNPGEYCKPDGTCADACEGAACPAGQTCEMGQCVPKTSTGEGGGGQGGSIFVGSGGIESGGPGVGGGGGSGMSAGGAGTSAGGATGGSGSSGDSSSCGCMLPGSGDTEAAAWASALLGAAGLALSKRLRRRKDRR